MSITPIRSFANPIFQQLNLESLEMSSNSFTPTIPYWSLLKPNFDFINEELNKSTPPYLLKTKVLEYITTYYDKYITIFTCLLYTSPSPRDLSTSRMPSSA